MTDVDPPEDELPESFSIDDTIDWSSASVDVKLLVELPYWLMLDPLHAQIEFDGHEYDVAVSEGHLQHFAPDVTDSLATLTSLELTVGGAGGSSQSQAGVATRRMKTVLSIPARCHADALAGLHEGHRARSATCRAYFAALCSGHLPVVNQLIERYRLLTYDLFPYVLSAWDAPVWMVLHDSHFDRVALLPYADWDTRPIVADETGVGPMVFLGPNGLDQPADAAPGELELLDSLNLIERGDYSGAVRRANSAIEVVLEVRLQEALSRRFPASKVNQKMAASELDVPGRFRQLRKLRGGKTQPDFGDDFDRIRQLRHKIVHGAYRIDYAERGLAVEAVLIARAIYDWLDNDPARVDRRNSNLALRSVGRHMPLFFAEPTQTGIIVSAH